MFRRFPPKLLYVLSTSSLAVLGLAVALTTAQAWLAIAFALAALVLSWTQHRWDGLGENLTPRCLAVAALLTTTLRTSDSVDLPLLVTGVMLLGIIALEQVLYVAVTTNNLHTLRLPIERTVMSRVIGPRNTYRLVTALTGVVAAATIASLTIGSTALSLAAGALVLASGVAFLACMALAWKQRRSAAHAGDAAVYQAVADYRPRFAIHFAGPAGSEYQLLMWLPYFDQLGDNYLIIMRDLVLFDRISKATDAPIVIAPGISQVEKLLCPSVKSVFYVNHAMQNSQLIRFGHLTHIQLMHGDSDKAVSRNPVSAMYDQVFVAGQAGIDRYHNHGVDIPERKFRIVGRPQLHPITVGPRARAEGEKPIVLYTPTWTGLSADANYSSLHISRHIIKELLSRDVVVWLRNHPYTTYNAASARQLTEIEEMLEADAAATGRAHRWGEATSGAVSLADCINAADVAISDISGAASDWMYSNKPFALTDPLNKGDDYEKDFPISRAAYVIDSQASNIAAVVTELLETDSLAQVRSETRLYYLGDIDPNKCVEHFLDHARATYAAEATPR
ncbi:CDP-glycerol glycerophosphotransferase family protein [Natronoglycomyces albus]|uniref:CDP-glycerol glycerophosphotransferase family protein n=1 Tax=Natronoglycomyces albus TaxID=2811108 RepID=A0A895XT36_9ACTN|nr:CDP-glycerol glycerophosphotransferase family protein [Natronoglycomyces albus]QSB04798.1 CDP-glycerol glycerophosphotransferase family protein [Natronoglycomyces albus]